MEGTCKVVTQFNEQQLQAIAALDQNIIVSASAGAGKTTVLIARLMKRILKDRVHIQQVCALTFTEAAAQEMKTRLLASLNKEKNNQDDEFLNEQIALVETAQITTIHSFCLNLIKNHAHVIGMNPERAENILDDAEVKIMKEEAFISVYNNWLLKDYEKTYKLVNYFSNHPLNTTTFKEVVFEASSWMRSRKDIEKSIKDLESVYLATSINEWPISYQNYFFEEYQQKITELIYHLDKIISIIEEEANEGTKAAENLPILYKKLIHLQKLKALTEQHNSGFYEQLPDALDFMLPAVRNSDRFKEAKAPLEKLLNEVLNFCDTFEKQFERMNQLYPLLRDIIDFSQDFEAHYQQLKIKENALDFDDFETYALNILKENDFEVARTLQNHYQEIMVDEFQDTNEVQDEIIRLISSGKNLFRVGDIKQSIYRFRGAKPDIMKELMRDDNHKNLYLSYNYRSKEPIVSFNNEVFDKLMNTTYYSQYTQHDHVQCGLDSQKVKEPKVEFHLFERDPETIYKLRNDEQKALHISQEIIKHVQEGYEFKDMTVLVRSHAQKKYLKKVFEEQNIPHYINEPIGFYNSEIIQDVLYILNYTLYLNDYYLAKLLNSKFFRLDYNTLARIKLINPSASLHENLKSYDKDLSDYIYNLVSVWKDKDIVSIIQDILVINNTYNEKLSIKDKTNLDFLLDKAIQFQQNNVPNVAKFVGFINALEDEKSSEASHLSVEDNVVEVMTVHQSKGLQFPLTFYWGAGPLNLMDHRDSIIFDDELGIGLNYIWSEYRANYKTLIRSSIEYKQKNEELEEVLRLLYVALTRAQSKLIIVDVAKEFIKQDVNISLLFNYKRQVDLLLATAPQHFTIVKINDASAIENIKLEKIANSEKYFTTPLALNLKDISSEIIIEEDELNFEAKYAMAYGTTLHESIEALPNRTWNEEDLKSIDPSIHNVLKIYNTDEFTQYLYEFTDIFHEMPFLLNDNEENISGIIDFLAINKNNHIVIVDFKSDNADDRTLIDRYQNQLKRYRKAIKLAYPEARIDSYIYSFYQQKYLLID